MSHGEDMLDEMGAVLGWVLAGFCIGALAIAIGLLLGWLIGGGA